MDSPAMVTVESEIIPESKALLSRKQILDFLRISKRKFYKLVSLGLPVRQEGGCWVGHKDELEEWFKNSDR